MKFSFFALLICFSVSSFAQMSMVKISQSNITGIELGPKSTCEEGENVVAQVVQTVKIKTMHNGELNLHVVGEDTEPSKCSTAERKLDEEIEKLVFELFSIQEGEVEMGELIDGVVACHKNTIHAMLQGNEIVKIKRLQTPVRCP